MNLTVLPGGDLIEQGLSDLQAGEETESALLVRIGAPRLRRAGIAVPADPEEREFPEHRLYHLLAAHWVTKSTRSTTH